MGLINFAHFMVVTAQIIRYESIPSYYSNVSDLSSFTILVITIHIMSAMSVLFQYIPKFFHL